MLTVPALGEAIVSEGAKGVTIYTSPQHGWMVSIKREGGFSVYYGSDLDETTQRGLSGGPQHPPDDDYFDGMELI